MNAWDIVKYSKYGRMFYNNAVPKPLITQQRPSTGERAQAPIDCPASARSTTTKLQCSSLPAPLKVNNAPGRGRYTSLFHNIE